MRLRRRRVVIGLCLIAASTAASLYLFAAAKMPTVNEERFNLAKEGMTVAQLSAIFGTPPTDRGMMEGDGDIKTEWCIWRGMWGTAYFWINLSDDRCVHSSYIGWSIFEYWYLQLYHSLTC